MDAPSHSVGNSRSRETGRWFLEDYNVVKQFANLRNTTVALLKEKAKEVKLRVWGGGRTQRNDRITFGLCNKPLQHIIEHRNFSQHASVLASTEFGPINPRLFTWNVRKSGLMQPSTCVCFCISYVVKFPSISACAYIVVYTHSALTNDKNVEKYFQYAAEFSASMSEVPRSVTTIQKDKQETQVWLSKMVEILVEERTKAQPETYKTIAGTLNRIYRSGDCLWRKFTPQDCKNKWHHMFPSAEDAVATVNYLKHMQTLWPGLEYKVEKIYSGT